MVSLMPNLLNDWPTLTVNDVSHINWWVKGSAKNNSVDTKTEAMYLALLDKNALKKLADMYLDTGSRGPDGMTIRKSTSYTVATYNKLWPDECL